MTSDSLLKYCDKHGISLVYGTICYNTSISSSYNGKNYIGIDDTLMTEAQKKAHLAHEIGHCETGSFYSPYAPLEIRSRHEYRADKWAIKKILPKGKMLNAMKLGYVEVWQLAEYFNITESMVCKALWIHFDKTM